MLNFIYNILLCIKLGEKVLKGMMHWASHWRNWRTGKLKWRNRSTKAKLLASYNNKIVFANFANVLFACQLIGIGSKGTERERERERNFCYVYPNAISMRTHYSMMIITKATIMQWIKYIAQMNFQYSWHFFFNFIFLRVWSWWDIMLNEESGPQDDSNNKSANKFVWFHFNEEKKPSHFFVVLCLHILNFPLCLHKTFFFCSVYTAGRERAYSDCLLRHIQYRRCL